MERFDANRSGDVELSLDEAVTAPAQIVWNRAPAIEQNPKLELEAIHANGQLETRSEAARRNHKTSPHEIDQHTTLHVVFDKYLHRLEQLKATLRQPPTQSEKLESSNNTKLNWSPRRRHPTLSTPNLLRGTLDYLERIEKPLLLAPYTTSFEEAFKRHEPMFHAVFYRKYAPIVREDAKQEALLALYRKWLKDKSILEQSSAYVVTAAIYGVSNWRKKGVKVRGREAQLLVDSHGKVAGEPKRNPNERWTDRIDLRLDVGKAVEVVLYEYERQLEYKVIYQILQDIREEIPSNRGRQASGLSFQAYKQRREGINAKLRTELAEYTLML